MHVLDRQGPCLESCLLLIRLVSVGSPLLCRPAAQVHGRGKDGTGCKQQRVAFRELAFKLTQRDSR